MTKKNKKGGLPPIAYIFMAIVTFFLVTNIYPRIKPAFVNNNTTNIINIPENMSIGNRILIADKDNKITPEKQQGKEYFAKGDYIEAEKYFQKSIDQKPNDPETVIYRNNAQIIKDKNYLKIGVVLPIGSNANVSQEMLRGVASSQTEINQKGGINGKKLLIQIVDDKNDPEIAKQVAKELIKDDQILAVIGSNASNPSLAAAPIYKDANLLMITPTSFSDGISTLAWRLVPSTKITGNLLADYVVNRAKKTKIAICY
ncbi:MAG TPA: ABC transporter substrate-binding protein, partial [Allocoleopsis sp.]